MKDFTCCFFGHRKITDTIELRTELTNIIEKLIMNDNIDNFLFGSKSQFNSLCYELVTNLKQKYPYIKRIYVRAEFPYIDDSYKSYLLESYDDTYFPDHITQAGKASYVERNCYMIDKSSVCVVYYDSDYHPQNRKSGTKIAYNYAMKKDKAIINIANDTQI